MSNEHIVNTITWLLTDCEGAFSDLNEIINSHPIGDWIRVFSQELYDRTAMPFG